MHIHLHSKCNYVCKWHFPAWFVHAIWISFICKWHCAKNELVHSHTERCCSSSLRKWPNGTKTRQIYTTGGESVTLDLEHRPEGRSMSKQKKGWSDSCCFLTPPATSYLHQTWCRNSICVKVPQTDVLGSLCCVSVTAGNQTLLCKVPLYAKEASHKL